MSLDITMIVLVVMAIWFFGSTVKKVLNGAGEMANTEFQELRADQVVRVMNQAVKRTDELTKISDKSFLTAEEIIAKYSKQTQNTAS